MKETQSVLPDQYTAAGVNVPLGDLFSSYCGEICRGSYINSRFVKVHDFSRGHFRGPRGFEPQGLPKGTIMTAGADGNGTKTIITSATGTHFDSAADFLAMTGGDMTRYGSMGLVIINDLNVASLGKDKDDPTFIAAKQLIEGMGVLGKNNDYVLFGGETAEMNDTVTSENKNSILKYIWAAVMIGVMHPDKMILGNKIKPGDRIIFFSDVVRANGISLLRRGLRHRYGDEWYSNPSPEARAAVLEAATPSALYDKFLVRMNGWTTEDFRPIVKAHGIANLSGGGITWKFGVDLLFRAGFSAKLSTLFSPPKVMKNCAEDLEISDKKCYGYWGCGCGTAVIVDENDAELFISEAKADGIEALDAGYVCETPAGRAPQISLISGFSGRRIVLDGNE